MTLQQHTRGVYVQTTYELLGEQHVQRYRETDGEEGYVWNGVPVLLLTVTGRKTGEQRTTPLIFARDGEDLLVVASVGGSPAHPQWFLNLQVDPNAEVQVLAERFPVRARAAEEGAERDRLWDVVANQWPNYDQYQERTDRVIPVVVLSPVQG